MTATLRLPATRAGQHGSSPSAPTAPPAWSPTPRSPSASTPPTSGSASAPASSSAASPRPTRPSPTWPWLPPARRWPTPASRRGASTWCCSRPSPTPTRRPPPRREVADRLGAVNAGALDVAAACAGLLLRPRARRHASCAAGTAEHVLVVGVEKLTDFVVPRRPRRRVHLRRRRGRRRRRAVRPPGHRPGRVGRRRLAEGRHHDDAVVGRVPRRARRARTPTLAMQGQAVFRWAVGEMSKVVHAGARGRRHHLRRPRRLRPAPGQHAHHRRDGALRSSCPSTSWSPATSRPPATPRPRRSRSRWTACSRAASLPSGGLALLIGFGAGLAYAAQVVELP